MRRDTAGFSIDRLAFSAGEYSLRPAGARGSARLRSAFAAAFGKQLLLEKARVVQLERNRDIQPGFFVAKGDVAVIAHIHDQKLAQDKTRQQKRRMAERAVP